jgi:uncharacterized protein (TIGR03437 family)
MHCRWAFLLLGAACFAQQQETVTYTYNGLPLFIAGDDADVISIAEIFVPRALTINTVTASLQLDYPNSGDLKVYLFSPGGVRTKLLENDCSVNGIDTTFDDAAPSSWDSFCPTELGRGPFRAEEPLANFRDDPSSIGTWRLAIENDRSDSRSGWLTAFSITITGTRQLTPTFVPETVVNAASRTNGSIAPGELVSIYGAAMGPTTPAAAPAGELPTSLGGVTVTFDGNPAPIVYASSYRVEVQAPFTLTPGTQTSIQVNNGGNAGRAVQVPVTSSAPGLVTLAPQGTGQVKATNQDGTLNGAGEAAPRGSIISLYAVGLGAVEPAVAEGAVPPSIPLSITVAPVAASIGGIPAPVHYAGLAPGMPGYYQLNIEIPAEARTGEQQLIVSTNNIATQNGVFVVVE